MKNFYFIGLFLLSMYSYAQNFNQYKRTWATYNGLSTSEPSYLDYERNGILELFFSISIGSTHDLNAYNLLRTDSTFTRITRPGVYYNYTHYNHAGQRVKYGYIDSNLITKLPFNNNYFVVKHASDTPFLIGEFDENYQYNVIDSLNALNNHLGYYILDSGNLNVPSYKIDENFNVYMTKKAYGEIPFEGNLAQNSKIEFFNLIGQKVYEQKVQSINRQLIHAPQLSNGTYILKYVSLEGNTDSQKIIIKINKKAFPKWKGFLDMIKMNLKKN